MIPAFRKNEVDELITSRNVYLIAVYMIVEWISEKLSRRFTIPLNKILDGNKIIADLLENGKKVGNITVGVTIEPAGYNIYTIKIDAEAEVNGEKLTAKFYLAKVLDGHLLRPVYTLVYA